MLKRILGALALLTILFGVAAAAEEFYPFEVATGQIRTPSENSGAPWFQDGATMYFGTGKDVALTYNDTTNRLEVAVPSDAAGLSDQVGQVIIETIGDETAGPMVATTNQILTTHAITNSSPETIVTFTHQPDYARVLTVTANASTSGYWHFTGTDIGGSVISEYINLSSASSGTGTKAFQTVTALSCKLSSEQSNKTFTVGIGNALGLNTKRATNTTLMASLDGTKDSISAQSLSGTVLASNTVTLATALDAAKPVKVWYII